MKLCVHCGERVALRHDAVWVHRPTRARHCSDGPIPRPAALPRTGQRAARLLWA